MTEDTTSKNGCVIDRLESTQTAQCNIEVAHLHPPWDHANLRSTGRPLALRGFRRRDR
ncbi:hypothetical protein [Bradyrhizobium guangdongense]|uniref:hypothetical protein n=1 Tax=Bradyrhizobium guangdongense TaxID=1325090 RepID=UPI001319F810|nr:hypothetical protein [Bradyrhizobium guangdongense]